jgi:hypothetical protein
MSDGALAYGAALVFGAIAVARMMPHWALVGGLPPGAPPAADFAQQVVAQRYFLTQVWGWPLLHVDGLMAPVGINLAFADGNPLASLIAKSVQPVLPPFTQAATPWLVLCWLLQPVAAVFALRGTGERRFWPAIIIAIMALSQPVFLWRIWHNSLASQFAILVMLGLYVRAMHGSRLAVWLAAALAVTLQLVHPYLMLMAMAVLAAAPMTLRLRRDIAWREAAAALGLACVSVVLLAVLLGYTKGHSPGGYGFYSMNLVSPFWPARSGLFPGLPITDEDATGGQRESYNYLGAGLLLLLLAVMTRPCDVKSAVRRHGGLAAVLMILTLVAVSHRVYAFHTQVLHIRTAVDVLQPFRSSGRLFWVVTYSLLMGGTTLLLRGRPRFAIVCLPVAAVLQVADGAAIRARDWQMLHEPAPWLFDPAQVRQVFRAHQRLIVLPPFGCPRGKDRNLMQLLWVAAETRMLTNTMYLARQEIAPDCDMDAAFRRAPAPGDVVMVQPGYVTRALHAPLGACCRQAGVYAICTSDTQVLAGLAPLLGDVRMEESPIW